MTSHTINGRFHWGGWNGGLLVGSAGALGPSGDSVLSDPSASVFGLSPLYRTVPSVRPLQDTCRSLQREMPLGKVAIAVLRCQLLSSGGMVHPSGKARQ